VPHLKPFSRSRVCKAVRTTKLYAIPESYLSANSIWGLLFNEVFSSQRFFSL
jgi:hypothetical protein